MTFLSEEEEGEAEVNEICDFKFEISEKTNIFPNPLYMIKYRKSRKCFNGKITSFLL